MDENIFDKLDFGPLKPLLDDDDITDISFCNRGQIWIRSLTQGSIRKQIPGVTAEFMEKLAFQCSNVMGTTFNNAKPFLDAESTELRFNFVHQSIATNGIACVIRKTPAKIRLKKEGLLKDNYFTQDIHDILIKCVEGHCNILVAGETGSGKTEFIKYLASHTKQNEKIITIEDTLELHLDKIFPERDIVAMKTNNVASYTDVLVTCMRQNPKWILLSEVRSAEAVSAVRNSISSGHNILSTIHADKASAIPYRLYSLMETDLDVGQFLTTIYRYIQIGVHIKAFYSKEYGSFHREMDEVTEFYVDDNNVPKSRIIYQKVMGKPMMCKPSDHLIEYLENQNIEVHDIIKDLPKEMPVVEYEDVDNDDSSTDSISTDSSNFSNNSESPEESESTTATLTDESTVSDDSNVVNSEASVQENIPIVDGQGESLPNMTDGNVQPLREQPVAVSSVVPQSAPVMQNIPTNNLDVQQQNVTVPTQGVTPQIVNVPQPQIVQTMQSPVVQTPPVMTNPQSVSIPTTQVSGIAKLGE